MTAREDHHALLHAKRNWFLSNSTVEGLTLRLQLENHHKGTCPGCGAEGWYLRGWWGRRQHPSCGARWVESPIQWLFSSLHSVGTLSIGLITDPNNVHEGCGTIVFGGCASLVVGLPFVFLLLPVQAAVWLFTTRPKPFTPVDSRAESP